MTEKTKKPNDYERKRKEQQCSLCSVHCRSDRLIGHLLTHKHNLTDFLNPKCRAHAIQNKLPMMFYHNSAFTDPREKKAVNENKLFCACLICGKGKYAGGHGSTHDFIRIHSKSDCVKQWDTVAHLFGELPVDTPPLPQAPAPQDTAKDRLIQTLTNKIAELELEMENRSKRFNQLWKENEQLKRQPQAPEPFRVPSEQELINPLLPECPEIPNEPEPEPEPEQPPTLAVMPAEPEAQPDFATLPVATVRTKVVRKTASALRAEAEKTQASPTPLLEIQASPANENRPGYFLAKSGKWLRRVTSEMPRPATTMLALPPLPSVQKVPMLINKNIDDLIAEIENSEPDEDEEVDD